MSTLNATRALDDLESFLDARGHWGDLKALRELRADFVRVIRERDGLKAAARKAHGYFDSNASVLECSAYAQDRDRGEYLRHFADELAKALAAAEGREP